MKWSEKLTIFVSENKEDDGQEIYDLIANIVHDGEPKDGSYRIHVNHRASGIWKEIQDLVVTDALPEMIPLSEAFIQIWVRRPKQKGKKRPIRRRFLRGPGLLCSLAENFSKKKFIWHLRLIFKHRDVELG